MGSQRRKCERSRVNGSFILTQIASRVDGCKYVCLPASAAHKLSNCSVFYGFMGFLRLLACCMAGNEPREFVAMRTIAQGAHSLKTHLHLKPHQFFDLSSVINESNTNLSSQQAYDSFHGKNYNLIVNWRGIFL